MKHQFDQHSVLLCRVLGGIAKAKGITHQQLADTTGFTRANISRLLAGRYSPELRTILSLCSAMGIKLYFEDKDGTADLEKIFKESFAELGWQDPDNN